MGLIFSESASLFEGFSDFHITDNPVKKLVQKRKFFFESSPDFLQDFLKNAVKCDIVVYGAPDDLAKVVDVADIEYQIDAFIKSGHAVHCLEPLIDENNEHFSALVHLELA